MEEPKTNESIQEFLKLLMENQPDKAHDYSLLLWQMDAMGKQLDAAVDELRSVKKELAGMREGPLKRAVARTVKRLENKLYDISVRLDKVWEAVTASMKKAVEAARDTGISALDKAVSSFKIRESLNAVEKDLCLSIADTKYTIQKLEETGHELRSVGSHLKNVGRALSGKARQEVDGGSEGRFQAAVLAPLRGTQRLMSRMHNTTLAAIGQLERLEQAAAQGREKKSIRKGLREQAGEKVAPPDKPLKREVEYGR